MFSFTEQFSATTDTAKSQLAKQLNIANEFATTAFDGVQQIIALNVSATKATVEKSSAAAKQLFEAKDPGEFFKLNAVQAPNFDNLLAYGQQLVNIATKTQTDLLAVVKEQIKEVSAAGAAVAAKPLELAAKAAAPAAASAPVAARAAAPATPAAAAPAVAAAPAPQPAPVSAAVPPAPAAAPVPAAAAPAAAEAAAPAPVVKAPEPKPVAAAVAEAVAKAPEQQAAQHEPKSGKAKTNSAKPAPAAEPVVLKAVKSHK